MLDLVRDWCSRDLFAYPGSSAAQLFSGTLGRLKFLASLTLLAEQDSQFVLYERSDRKNEQVKCQSFFGLVCGFSAAE